jgi:hypothetical protein
MQSYDRKCTHNLCMYVCTTYTYYVTCLVIFSSHIILFTIYVCQTVRSQLLILEPWVLSRLNLCEVCAGRSGTRAGVSPSFFSFTLLIIIPPLLHTHLSPLLAACNNLSRQHIITSSTDWLWGEEIRNFHNFMKIAQSV